MLQCLRGRGFAQNRDRAVIIAVVAVRMVQMAIHDVIDMIAVRHGFVAATVAVQVARLVAIAVVRHATAGILGGHFEAMLIVMALVRMVQMAVVNVVNMAVMLNGGMAAIGAVIVVGMVVLGMFDIHNCFPL